MAQWEVLELSAKQTSVDYEAILQDVAGVAIRLGYRNYEDSAELVKDPMLDTHYSNLEGKTKIGYLWESNAITEDEAIAEAQFCYSLLQNKQRNIPIYFVSKWANVGHTGRADNLSKDDRTYLLIVWANTMKSLGCTRIGVYAEDNWFMTNFVISYIYEQKYSLWVVRDGSYKPSYVADYDGWCYSTKSDNDNFRSSYFYNNIAHWDDPAEIDISDMTLNLSPTKIIYNGEEQKPVATIEGLTEDTDFIVDYSSNINAGYALCTCKGINNYTGIINKKFYIEPKSLSEYELVLSKNTYDYTGNPIIPDYSIESLVAGTDYTIICSNNIDPGQATIYATGRGNYKDTISKKYIVYTDSDISKKIVTLIPDYCVYDGFAKEPDVFIPGLYINRDYTVTYENNINAGIAKVIVTGINNYSGINEVEFNILELHISTKIITVVPSEFIYDGTTHEPDVVIEGLIRGVDFDVTYDNNIDAGYSAIATATGKGNYTGTVGKAFKISPASITDRTVAADPSSMQYTGKPLTPIPIVEGLVFGEDFGVSYSQNINIGTANIYAVGINNYTGTIEGHFTITKGSLIGKELTFDPDRVPYDGTPKKPTPIIEDLVLGRDYTIAYSNNIDIGTATGTATGKGNFEDTTTGHFEILPEDISKFTLVLDEDTYIYDGSAHEPGCHIDTLVEGTDYYITYENNINAGIATAVANGIGRYGGTTSTPFVILPESITIFTPVLIPSEFIYDGKEKIPEVNIEGLEIDKDFKVYYYNNINAGEAYCTIYGIGNYDDSLEEIFIIQKKDITDSEFDILLDQTVFYYDGTPKYPVPIYIIIEGNYLYEYKDYNKSYLSNINAGFGYVRIDGIGNYTGTVKKPFTIMPIDIFESGHYIEDIPDQYYKGDLTPEITVSGGLVLNKDYTVQYIDTDTTIINNEPDDGVFNFGNIDIPDSETANGDYDFGDLIEGVEPGSVAYDDYNFAFGLGTAIVTGIGNYIGNLMADFNILLTPIKLTTVKLGTATIYSPYRVDNGIVTITFNGYTLIENTDYILGERTEEDFGDFTLVTFEVTGINNFCESRVYRFRVIAEEPDIPDTTDDGVFNFGNIDIPDSETAIGDYDFGDLIEGTDPDTVALYDYDFEKIGKIYIDFYDIDDGTNVDDHGRRRYEDPDFVDPYLTDINTVPMYIQQTSMHYNFGRPIKVNFVTNLVEDIDYKATYNNNYELGIADVFLTGIGDYTGIRYFQFSIIPRSILHDGVIDCGRPNERGYYNINNRRVYVIDQRDLILNEEYTETLEQYINDNDGLIYIRMTATGINNFSGTIAANIPIGSTLEDINYYNIYLPSNTYVYTRYEIRPIPLCDQLVYGDDFDIVEYTNNINVGHASMTIQGSGYYTGTRSFEFDIIPKSVENAKIAIGPITDEDYDHSTVRVFMEDDYELNKETEVDISFHDYTIEDLKISDVTATGKGNYNNSVTRRFYLNSNYLDIADTDVDVEFTEYEYTGYKIEPKIVSEDRIEGVDYIIRYHDEAISIGEWHVYIFGRGNYTGSSKTLTFNIVAQSLSTAHIECGGPDESGYYDTNNFKVYDKNDLLLTKDIDYTVDSYITPDYEEAENIITFTITGIGNYKDNNSASFPISDITDEEVPINPEDANSIQARVPVMLINAPVYARYSSKNYDSILNGIYLIYDNNIINNRVRVAKSKYAFTNPCMITGWVSLDDILKKNIQFKLYEKVIVTGTLYQHEDGSGMKMEKNEDIMYITYINESYSHGIYNYGLSSEVYTSVQGYCDTSILKHSLV